MSLTARPRSARFRSANLDSVLLDVMLPGLDGMEVCRRIRAESGVPIVMLTARTDTVDVVVGLESGADYDVVKPFKPQKLIARIRARLRRGDEPEPERLEIGDLVIDVAGHSVKRDGKGALPHASRVRPAGGPRTQALASLHAGSAARAGLGLPPRW